MVEYIKNIDTRLTTVSSTIPNFRGDIDSLHLLDPEKEDKEFNAEYTRVINDTNYDNEQEEIDCKCSNKDKEGEKLRM